MRCSAGHENAPESAFCTTCGLVMTSTPQGGALPSQGAPTTAFGSLPQYGSMPPPMPVARRRARWIIPVVIGAVAAAVVLGIVIVNAAKPKPESVTVQMTVYGVYACDLGLGYFDVPGSVVTLSADGRLVGSGNLSAFGDDQGYGCMFSETIPAVPSDASAYSLQIGRRGTLTVSRSELAAANWIWSTSLGE